MPELNHLDSFSSYTPSTGSIITLFAEEDGKIVMKAKKSDGTIETLYGKGASGSEDGDGDVEFFRCASVGGPYTASGYVVSGAGVEAVNGVYLASQWTTEEGSTVYKHATQEYYYIDMWGEKGIVTSPTDYPGDGLYLNPWEEGWSASKSEYEPAPSVAFSESILMNQDDPKTWTGYKVVQTDNDCTLELDSPYTDVCTHGYEVEASLAPVELTYHHGFRPEVGRVYTKDASIMLGGIHVGASPSLVFHKSFRTWTDRAETGQLLYPTDFSSYDPEFKLYTTDSGKTIPAVGKGMLSVNNENGLFPTGSNPFTAVLCAAQTGTRRSDATIVLRYGSNNDLFFNFHTEHAQISFNNTNTYITHEPEITHNRLYHMCVTYDGATVTFYVDGSVVGQADATLNIKQETPLKIGCDKYDPFAVADVRIYNRALSASEVAALAEEFK